MDTNDTEITIDLAELFKALFRAKYFLIMSALLGFFSVYLCTSLLIDEQYTASLRLYVSNGAAGDVIDSGSLSASERLGSTYIAILQDDYVLQKVADSIGINHTGKEIRNMVSIASVNSTEVLEITAVTDDPYLSAQICNTLGYQVAQEMIEEIFEVAAIKVISPASVPESPSGPRTARNSALGFAAGLMLSCGLVCLLEILDNTLKSPEEVKNKYDLPILGEIPDFTAQYSKEFRLKKRNQGKVKLATTKLNQYTPFSITESYKSLRTNISFVMSMNKNHILLITSANACESKSTTASNLALTLAESGMKVLLIDADMRKPMQHMIYNRKNKGGLSDVIAGMKEFEDVLHKAVVPSLDLLTSGTQSPNPSELLSSLMMKGLLMRVNDRYDMVLIDTPPVNLVTDAISLSKYVPNVLLTVRHKQTKDRDLEAAVSKLKLVNSHIVGVVFTCWREERKAYQNIYYSRLAAGEKN